MGAGVCTESATVQAEIVDVHNAFRRAVEPSAADMLRMVVWNTSYKVGCGVALCPGNIYFYGCHYYRAGNFVGVPPYTSGPPCAACPDHCVENLCTNPCPHVDKFSNRAAMKGRCWIPLVARWCPASCRCSTEIIPVS